MHINSKVHTDEGSSSLFKSWVVALVASLIQSKNQLYGKIKVKSITIGLGELFMCSVSSNPLSK